MRLRTKIAGTVSGFLFLVSLIAAVLYYATETRQELSQVDELLLRCATYAGTRLPADFHDKISDRSSVPPEQYAGIVKENNRICDAFGLQYLWSVLVVDPDTIYFTSATSTSRDFSKGDHAAFFDRHTDPAAFAMALASMQPTYGTFRNEWGYGRMVLLPARDVHGRVFMFGASIRIDSLLASQRRQLIVALCLGSALLLVSALLGVWLADSLSRPIAKLAHIAKEIMHGRYDDDLTVAGTTEVVSLAESLGLMRGVIREKIAALEAREQQLRVLSDNLPNGLVYQIEAGSDGQARRFLYLSAGVEQLHGISTDEALHNANAIFGQVIEEDRQLIASAEAKAFAERKPFSVEARTRLQSGDIRWRLFAAAPLETPDRRVVWNGIELDITDRKRAEEAMRRSEEKLAITLDSIGDAVIATDAAGEITRMNPIAAKLTGWIAAEAIGHQFDEVFHIINTESRKAIESPAARILRDGQAGGMISNTAIVSRDGTERIIADSGSPIRDSRGSIVGVVLVFRDVTEQRRMEDRLRQSEKLEAIGQLAGGVAHDFNNQLCGIMGFAELLAEQLTDQTLNCHAVKILSSARHAAELTRQLLAFGRKGKYLSLPVDTHKVIAEVVDLLCRSVDKRITIKQHLNAMPSTVVADPSQLQNAILNLGLNARDAMPLGGELTFATRVVNFEQAQPVEGLAAGRYVQISVTDTGVGMNAEVKKRLFEPFFTTKASGKGTGLGLASAYGAVKNHGGTIRV
ncbi:MAG: PAS domain S-box protein, partial [bacterium]